MPFCKGEFRGSTGLTAELWLLPFDTSLSEHFTEAERRDWADAMLARGIRIANPIEGYVKYDAEQAAVELPEEEPLQEDELSFLRERQALMPY